MQHLTALGARDPAPAGNFARTPAEAAAARRARGGQLRFESVRRIGRSALGRRAVAVRSRDTSVASTAPVRVVSSARSRPYGEVAAAMPSARSGLRWE